MNIAYCMHVMHFKCIILFFKDNSFQKQSDTRIPAKYGAKIRLLNKTAVICTQGSVAYKAFCTQGGITSVAKRLAALMFSLYIMIT